MSTACIQTTMPVGFTLITLLLFGSATFADMPQPDKYSSIQQHLAKRSIACTIKGLGGHSENCIAFNLRNMRGDTLFVKIEPGQRLVSADTTLQDIFIVKENRFILLPHQKKTVEGYGFCCEANMRGPHTNALFSIGFMAPAPWVQLADTINKYTFDPTDIQHAVWVLSNNHSLSAVSTKDSVLRKTLAAIKGIENPWYATLYEQDTARLFSGRAEMLTATLPFYVTTNCMVSIVVRNATSGKLMAIPLQKSPHHPGSYLYDLNVSVKNWPKGDYDLLIYEDEYNVNLKKTFRL